jgi:hypothetical protein
MDTIVPADTVKIFIGDQFWVSLRQQKIFLLSLEAKKQVSIHIFRTQVFDF